MDPKIQPDLDTISRVSVRVNDQPTDLGSHLPDRMSHTTTTTTWKWCGENVPRNEIVFFVQVIFALTIILACIIHLALKDENSQFWMVMLSGCMGYIMPNPSMKVPSKEKSNNL